MCMKYIHNKQNKFVHLYVIDLNSMLHWKIISALTQNVSKVLYCIKKLYILLQLTLDNVSMAKFFL